MANADRLAHAARSAGITVAVAESLTSGALASAVGAGEDASRWFAGGVVAYQTAVKESVLGVERGIDPCSAACAEQLAAGVRALLGADIAVSTTGVGGPDSENGHPPGTVFIGWSTRDAGGHLALRLRGEPSDILRATVEHAIEELVGLASPAGGCS